MPKVTVDDGVEINYYLDDFTDPWAEVSDTILMHHGSAENATFLAPMVPALARRYRVLRFDARGRGESSAPPEDSTLSGASVDNATTVGERFVKDALSLIGQLGIQKVHWWGVASGFTVGVLFATSHPDRIKSLTGCTGCVKFPKEVWEPLALGEKDGPTAIRKLGTKEWYRRGALSNVIDRSKADARIVEWELSERGKIPAHVYASVWKWATEFDVLGLLPQIKVPTLLISVTESKIIPLEQQCFVLRQIPNARQIVFEDVGHLVHVLDPDRVTSATLDFLQTVV